MRPKTFEVLAYIVERHGRLVAKAELIEAVWPDTAVTDNSLAQCLVEIRRALGDDSQQYVRTVARRGYVFAAPVTKSASAEFPLSFSGVNNEVPPSLSPAKTIARIPVGRGVLGVILLAVLAAGSWFLVLVRRPAKQELTYSQITNFTDSAVS